MARVDWIGVVLSSLLLGACTDLGAVEIGVCGNGVVEAGEDCDGSAEASAMCGAAETSAACRFTCDQASATDSDDAGRCPDGYECGSDYTCRAWSGAFEEVEGSPFVFSAQDFYLGDADGDSHLDIVGVGGVLLTALYGTGDGTFDDALDLRIHRAGAKVSFSDLNDDGMLDVLVPMEGGLYTLLGNEQRGFDQPVHSVTEWDAPTIITSLGSPFEDPLLALVGGGDKLFAARTGAGAAGVVWVPCGVGCTAERLTQPLAKASPAFSADPGAPTVMAIALLGARSVSFFMTTKDAANPLIGAAGTTTGVALPAGYCIGTDGAMFGDVDGDGRPDLLVNMRREEGGSCPAESECVLGSGVCQVGLSLNIGTYGFGWEANVHSQALFEPSFAKLDVVVVVEDSNPGNQANGVDDDNNDFHLDVLNGAADFSGDNVIDAVTPYGVFITSFGGARFSLFPGFDCVDRFTGPNRRLCMAGAGLVRGLGKAQSGDFNNDGNLDFTSPDPDSTGVFVYLGTGVGIFSEFFITTEQPASDLRVGDFDGDFVDDIAYIERGASLAGGTTAKDRLWVSFGSVDGGPSDPVLMGELDRVIGVEPVFASGGVQFDFITDLAVSVVGDTASTSAFFLGKSTRRMLAGKFLINNGQMFTPLQVFAGKLWGPDGPTQAFAIAPPGETGTGNAGTAPGETGGAGGEQIEYGVSAAFVLTALADGTFDSASDKPIPLSGLGECALRNSSWGMGDMGGHSGTGISIGGDELVALLPAESCGTVATGDGAFGKSTVEVGMLTVADDGASIDAKAWGVDGWESCSPTDLSVVDVDGDETSEIAVFCARQSSAQLLRFSDGAYSAVPRGCNLTGGDPDTPPNHVLAMASMDDPAGRITWTLTRSGLCAERPDGSVDKYPGTFGGLAEQVRVADINGDGLLDIVALFNNRVQVLLAKEAAPVGGRSLEEP